VRIIVPDASILIKWVLPSGVEPDQDSAYALRDLLVAGKVELKLPPLWIYEVANTLGRMFPEHAQSMIESLLMLSFSEPDWDLVWLGKALQLANRYKVSFYDAAYHALALTEGGLFVTADLQYVRKTKAAGAVVALRDWRPK
jgi:predicted nucleic acid-binding protein